MLSAITSFDSRSADQALIRDQSTQNEQSPSVSKSRSVRRLPVIRTEHSARCEVLSLGISLLQPRKNSRRDDVLEQDFRPAGDQEWVLIRGSAGPRGINEWPPMVDGCPGWTGAMPLFTEDRVLFLPQRLHRIGPARPPRRQPNRQQRYTAQDHRHSKEHQRIRCLHAPHQVLHHPP